MNRVFGACPHDIVHDPEKWTTLVEYIGRKTGLGFHFRRFESFDAFADNFSNFSFVYAHSLHAIQLRQEMGYTPVAKYADTYDEAVIICQRAHMSDSLRDTSGKRVACVYGSPSHAAFLIDLNAQKLSLNFEPVLKDTYSKVLMAVAIGEADYGVILKSAWAEMLTMKERVRPIYTTALRSLVHVFMAAPSLEDETRKLREALGSLRLEAEGQHLLERLKCSAIVPFNEQDLSKLEQILLACNYG